MTHDGSLWPEKNWGVCRATDPEPLRTKFPNVTRLPHVSLVYFLFVASSHLLSSHCARTPSQQKLRSGNTQRTSSNTIRAFVFIARIFQHSLSFSTRVELSLPALLANFSSPSFFSFVYGTPQVKILSKTILNLTVVCVLSDNSQRRFPEHL